MAESDKNQTPSPPWEALHLVAHYLGPKTLAIASCVSRSWHLNLSSDNLWLPICAADFPSLSAAFSLSRDRPKVSLRRVYGAGAAAASRLLRRAPKPRFALHSLAFALDVRLHRRSVAAATLHPGRDLGSDGAFRFRVELPEGGPVFRGGGLDAAVRVSWHVVTEGWGAVFSVMDSEGNGRFVHSPAQAAAGGATEGWFSKELPAPGCCSSAAAASGLVAELKVGLRPFTGGGVDGGGGGEGWWRVEEVCVGVLNVMRWRYVGVEDGLRYLQHFLLPC